MRKRILSVVMLSLLAVGAFAGMASATAYFLLDSLEADPSTVTATEFPYKCEITVTANYHHNPKGSFTNAKEEKAITWSVAFNPATMADGFTADEEATDMTTSGTKNETKEGTVDAAFSGKVKSAGTITITGDQDGIKKTVTITVGGLKAPVVPALSFKTATAGKAIEDKVFTLTEKPDKVKIKFGDGDENEIGAAQGVAEYDGIKATVSALATGATSRTITFSGTPNFANKSGLEIVVTAENAAGSTTKTGAMKVNGIKPTGFGTKPDTKDLSEALDATKKVIAVNKEIEVGDNYALTFELDDATLPVTITAKNLPAGLVLEQTAGLDADENEEGVGTATAIIKGKPTKVGKFTNISITATNDDGNYTDGGYSITVLDEPAFTTATLPDLTWNKAYSVTLKATGGIDGYPVSFDVVGTLPEGLSLDKTKGIIKGTFKEADDEEGIAFVDKGEVIEPLTLKVGNALKIVEKEYDLKIKAVKPTIVDQSTLQKKLDNMALSYDHEFTFTISADGPGTIKWDVPKLPDGVTSAEIPATEEAPTTVGLKLTGTPGITMKNETIKIAPYNGAGSASFNLKFNVTYPSVDITLPDPAIESPQSVDKDTTVSYTFTAEPGPIVWKAKGLPSGLKLSIDKSVDYDTKAVVTGQLKSATKIDKDGKSLFYITAKNKVTGVEKTVSVDLKVYDVPKITTSSLPALTTGKAYKGKLKGTGSTVSTDMKWTIKAKVSGDTAEAAALPFTSKTGGDETGAEGTAKLDVEYDKKTGDPTIVGSLDRIPTDGALLVHVDLATSGGKAEKDFVIKVKGVAPKFTTTTLPTFKTDSDDNKIVVTGTQPITMKAYIDPSAAKKFFGGDGTASIDISTTATGGFKFTDSANGEGNLEFTAGSGAFKGLPITFAATNAATAKPVVKVIKVNVEGKGIELTYDDKTASPDMTFFAKAGEAITEQVFKLSGDAKPVELTTSLGTGEKNGIKATIDSTAGTITISGTPTDEKETKTPITITAKNLSTNKKYTVKFTVVGMTKPVITTKSQTKEIQVGKSLNLKLQAKGSKIPVSKTTKEAADPLLYATRDVQYNPISWKITSTAETTTLEDIKKLGLSFDAATGTFKGTPTTTTSADDAYKPYVFTVKAENEAGESDEAIDITIGVKGRKIKFASKAIVINKGGNSFLDSPDQMLKTDIGSNDATAHVRFTWADSGYSTYGFEDTIDPAGGEDAQNYGKLSGTFDSIPATRGASLKIQAENMGTTIKGAVKVVINDADPDIDGEDAKDMTADSSAVVTDTMDFKLTDASKMLTGATKMKWTLSKKSTNAKLNVTLKADSDGSGATATLKVQKMTSKDAAVEAKFAVTVQNTITKASKTKEVTVTINPPTTSALPAKKDALPEDKKSDEAIEEVAETETETEAEEETAEGTVSYGEARTEEWLTADERAAIAEAGYVIAAVLPEVTADADGQYDLDAVTLSENAPAGESLVWFAFPRNAEKSDDDTIAEFYDEAGAEITAVPESRNVIASPWLREGVTYAPVIAVKAPVTSETKDSLDEAEEGDTVTLEALEEAAENASDDEAPAEE